MFSYLFFLRRLITHGMLFSRHRKRGYLSGGGGTNFLFFFPDAFFAVLYIAGGFMPFVTSSGGVFRVFGGGKGQIAITIYRHRQRFIDSKDMKDHRTWDLEILGWLDIYFGFLLFVFGDMYLDRYFQGIILLLLFGNIPFWHGC